MAFGLVPIKRCLSTDRIAVCVSVIQSHSALLCSATPSSSRAEILEAVGWLMPTKNMQQLRDMDSQIWDSSMWWLRLQELRQKWIRQSESVRTGCQAMLEHSVSTGIQQAEFCAEVRNCEATGRF